MCLYDCDKVKHHNIGFENNLEYCTIERPHKYCPLSALFKF